MVRMSVQQRSELLLDAALTVIARDGIAHATTRAITDEAGMRRGSFHYCFESKDELFQALVTRHIGDMVNTAEATWDPNRTLAENLLAGISAFVSFGRAHPQEELLSYELTNYAMRSKTPEGAVTQYNGYDSQTSRYLNFVAEQANVEWSIPTPVLARMLTTMVNGSLLHWLVDRNDEATDLSIAGFSGMLATVAQVRGAS